MLEPNPDGRLRGVVLIVDDSPFLRNSLKEVLVRKFSEPEKLQIIEAGNRAVALDEFDKHSPDLVLLDIVMREGEKEGV
ncbi:MAG: response regulator, partial [Holophaga sp.]|nr:response regulator [Holophaga sp.]